MTSRITIGDPHGCILSLKALIAQFPPGVPFSISGDLIDRGPGSAQVVQFCIDNNIDVTRGNHEKMALDWYAYNPNFIGTRIDADDWIGNGGAKALMSYGFKVTSAGYNTIMLADDTGEATKMFKEHMEYFKNLPFFREYPEVKDAEGRYLVVSHSSINSVWKHKDKPEFLTDGRYEQTVIWGRPTTIKDVPEIYNVFGHTPQSGGPRVKVPFANVDTGCCFGKKEHREEGYGKLTAIQYPEMIIYSQDNIDDEIIA